MNEIPRIVYVSPAIFFLVLFSWIIGRLQELFILFAVVSIHESFHILVAWMFRVKLEKVVLTPMGMMAKLNHTTYKKAYQEILIAAAGPLSNLIMAAVGYLESSHFLDKSELVSFFILANISLLILNILPVLPLDGGRVFKSIFLAYFGYSTTIKIMFVLSRIISILLVLLGIYQLFNFWYNWSLLFIGVFIYLWSYKEKDEFQYLLLREIIYKKQNIIKEGIYRVEYIASFVDRKIVDVFKDFYSSRYHVVKVMDQDMNLIAEITESELLDCVTSMSYNATLKDAVEYCRFKQK